MLNETNIATTPVGFAELILGRKPYDWQKKVLWEFHKDGPVRVALSANNEAGKTQEVSVPLALWFATVKEDALVIFTASVERQVKDVFFHALKKHQHLYPKAKPLAMEWAIENGRIIGFVTNSAGKFESWHGKNFLLIGDEAKSIVDPIFTAFDRCRPSHILLTSSPGPKRGHFYKCFTDPNFGYKTFKITAYDCPHIPQDHIDYIIAKYGVDHPFTRSTIFGEFMGDDGDVYVITTDDMASLKATPPGRSYGKRKCAFIDFSAGGDETVIAVMDGNEILPLIYWRDKDTMSTVGKCIRKLREMGVEEKDCWYDEGGIGIPMGQAMKETGYAATGINNANSAYDPRYMNRGAEMWWDTQYMIRNLRIILPEDDILEEQLTNRFQKFDGKARLGVESKEDMRARGLNSPDRADAVCGVVSNYKWGYAATISSRKYDPLQIKYDELENNRGRGQHAGFSAGDY